MKSDDNLLGAVPVHASAWREAGDGRVQIVQERVRNRLLKKVVAALGRSEHFHIRLDEFGSAAWLACDGRRDVAAIAALLRERFGPSIEPAETRTGRFFLLLFRNRFVYLHTPVTLDKP